MLLLGLVVSEEVQGKGPRAVIDVMDGFIQPTIADDRQNRTKDLILHHLHVRRGFQDQCQRNFAGAILEIFPGRIDFHQLGALLPGVLQVALQAIVLPLIDDGGEIVVVPQARIHLGKAGPEFVDKRLHPVGGTKHVVWRHAGLPCVERLAKGNPLRSVFHRYIRRDHGRGFATQLQGDRRQVLSRCLHDQLAY